MVSVTFIPSRSINPTPDLIRSYKIRSDQLIKSDRNSGDGITDGSDSRIRGWGWGTLTLEEYLEKVMKLIDIKKYWFSSFLYLYFLLQYFLYLYLSFLLNKFFIEIHLEIIRHYP